MKKRLVQLLSILGASVLVIFTTAFVGSVALRIEGENGLITLAHIAGAVISFWLIFLISVIYAVVRLIKK